MYVDLTTEGIYRISGQTTEVVDLKEKYDNGMCTYSVVFSVMYTLPIIMVGIDNTVEPLLVDSIQTKLHFCLRIVETSLLRKMGGNGWVLKCTL